MDTSRRLSHYRTVRFGENIRANFLDRTDSRGHDHVAIELRRQASQGPSWVFKTDLDRLEAVVARADEIMKNPRGLGASFSCERINDYKVDFHAWPTQGQPQSLDIKLETTGEKRQVFALRLDRLKAIVKEGQDVERDLGYDQKRWHSIVYAASLKQESESRAQAKVFKSVESPEEARRLIKDNESLALYSEPRRRPLEEGKEIDVRHEAAVELIRGDRRTVAAQIARNTLEDQRQSEHYVVARWGYADSPPVVGMRVVWEGGGPTYKNEFQDFKAKPDGGRDRGDPAEELFVLIRRDDRMPGNGTIEAMSSKRLDMTAQLAQAEMAERRHREMSIEFHKQSF